MDPTSLHLSYLKCTLENVHNLADYASMGWRVDLIESIFSNTKTELIRSMPLSIKGKEDALIKHHELMGVFSVKLSYHVADLVIR